jgi:hypothetical protein
VVDMLVESVNLLEWFHEVQKYWSGFMRCKIARYGWFWLVYTRWLNEEVSPKQKNQSSESVKDSARRHPRPPYVIAVMQGPKNYRCQWTALYTMSATEHHSGIQDTCTTYDSRNEI